MIVFTHIRENEEEVLSYFRSVIFNYYFSTIYAACTVDSLK